MQTACLRQMLLHDVCQQHLPASLAVFASSLLPQLCSGWEFSGIYHCSTRSINNQHVCGSMLAWQKNSANGECRYLEQVLYRATTSPIRSPHPPGNLKPLHRLPPLAVKSMCELATACPVRICCNTGGCLRQVSCYAFVMGA